MQPFLVLFDIDGTLLRPVGVGRRALTRTFAELFGRPEVFDGVSFTGSTDRDIFRAGLAAADQPEARLSEVETRYLCCLSEEVQQTGDAADPAMVRLVESLAARPLVQLGLVTGNVRAAAAIKLAPSGLGRYFPRGAFGCESSDRAELVRLAIQRTRESTGCELPAHRICHVGDAASDVLAAKANGIIAVAIGAKDGAPALRALGAQHHFPTTEAESRFEAEVLA
jgi:phosphoglycolate phosphatase-like HAD superfamily hydrolase